MMTVVAGFVGAAIAAVWLCALYVVGMFILDLWSDLR